MRTIVALEAEMVSEVAIVECCSVGDVPQLQRWARQGVRVVSAGPLYHAAGYGMLEAVRVLIKELGAKSKQALLGATPLYMAAQEGLSCDASSRNSAQT
jgi:hypothetical protein